MSDSRDFVVIGGGVIGLTIARRLAMEGATVTIVERGQCGREASWAGAGILAPCNPHRTDAVARLQDRSLAMYPVFCDQLLAESGVDPERDDCGELDLILSEDSLSIARSDAAAGQGRKALDGQPAFELIGASRARQLEPVLSKRILGAMHCRLTGQVRNPRLLTGLRASCQRLGVNIRENCPATSLAMEGSRTVGVNTPYGSISAGRTILAAGAWSSQLHPRLAALMPVHPVRGQMILLKFDQPPFYHVVSRGRTYLVPRRDGHVLLGSTEEPEAGFSKRNTGRAVAKLIETAVSLVPMMEQATVVATWAGLRPGTLDDMPYLGLVPGFEGLIAATGHFRSGLTLAPATAEYIAAIARGQPYELDLRCCLPGRSVGT